jgi:hypothetical protein
LVVELDDVEALAEGVVDEHGPAGALDGVGGGFEVAAEGVEGAEVFVDGGAEFAVGFVAAVGGEVGPEDGVVDVAAEVEGEVLLQSADGAEVAGFAGFGELFQGGVDAGDVGGVVFVVVEFHDLARDVGLQRCVVVGQIGKLIDSH